MAKTWSHAPVDGQPGVREAATEFSDLFGEAGPPASLTRVGPIPTAHSLLFAAVVALA